jgi:hydroxyacylglutathione hydrolase
MIFKQINSGGDRNFAYLIASEKTSDGVLVDPSPDVEKVMQSVGDNIRIKYVINSHSHYDHAGGNDFFSGGYEKRPVTFINAGNAVIPEDGDIISPEDLVLEITRTPGHTPDSICIKSQNNLLTGDTLFVGKVGGTYSREEAAEEFDSLRKLAEMDSGIRVWPGHDYGVRPYSTIGEELDENPFMKRLDDFEEFLWLKQNWARYKIEHGIK